MLDSAGDVSALVWDELAGNGRQRAKAKEPPATRPGDERGDARADRQKFMGNPFLCHGFFMALEQSGSATEQTGWQPRHVLLRMDREPVALMPMFLKSHSMGEYVFDHAWADALERAGADYYPKLQSSIPFTPVSAPKLMVINDDEDKAGALLEAARQLAIRYRASSVHATFVTEWEERLALEAGWLTRRDIQFHWENAGYGSFDDFLGTLTARKRKMIKKERKKALAGNIRVHWLEGKEITESHWDSFFEFYQNTGARKWGRPYLTREFFSMLSRTMPQSLLLIMASTKDRFVAGALNFIGQNSLGKKTIFGRYWGCVENIAFLHFELCYYQAMEYAIAHDIRTIEAGAQGGHKLARGYLPRMTRSIHWLQNPYLHEAVKNYLAHEREIVMQNRQILMAGTPFKSSNNDD